MLRHLPILFIVFTVLIDGIGIGLIFPVMPDLIRDVTGRTLADAALWGGVLATGYAVMQFLFGPIVGNLSDRFGRKPVLISALFVMMLDYLVMAVAHTIWLLLIGRLIAGLTAATHATAAAYMADISAPEDREKRFGLVHAAMGVGFAVGPMIGGLLAGIDTRAPFYAAAGIAGLNMVFGLLVMPESLTRDKRRPFHWTRANPFAAFRAIGSLSGVKPLLLVFGLYEMAYFVYPAIWSFYGVEKFGFDARMIGLTLFAFGLSMGLAQSVLIGPLVSRFGAYRVTMGGILADIVVFATLGVTSSVPLVWIVTVLSGISSVTLPALQGTMSRATPDTQQGELQGVIGSIAAMATILSPLIMTETFAIFSRPGTAHYLPGAPFLLSMAIVILAGIVLWRWRVRRAGSEPKPA
ncbi:MFS transporter, DHA1 family, tetracycline resistance protein [Celeribacter baekdonensis]|uniref:MFS transporter, DHA1 family, tetracycline resistance protein n=1 Tax=Celeribacter baekdonensis TaxID=875171 RepID=A0A1G7JLU0_9RHOB|nr:TCR/Tet family MFS transporter [Celeribacter baekdonensis]SDF25912.1 MFS transporter, DHA1 family, tetracycline resistance protein [Celeribacter baekdonensis]